MHLLYSIDSIVLKDRLLWFEAVLVKRLYLRLYY